MSCELGLISVCFNLCISVCPLTIYVLCLVSYSVFLSLTTFPQYPTERGPTAQKTGKYLRCGPLELSASQTLPPVSGRAPRGLNMKMQMYVHKYNFAFFVICSVYFD